VAKYFSAGRIAELNAGRETVHRQFKDLGKSLPSEHTKVNVVGSLPKTRFCRRLKTLVRTIDQLYGLLPPEQEDRIETMSWTLPSQSKPLR
jgi:hypothetical protein